MKIGLPKLRLSRKLLIITLGITVLLGGTSAAALYFKSSEFGLDGAESAIGGECTDVQTMVLKTPSNRLWLRRFIRMENASGPERVRTALRVAGLLAKKNAVDLIHVSVLDSHGPTLRSQMRARSIGAEVLIAMKPDAFSEMKSPAMASYYEGPVSDAGRYYGDKVVVDIDEIGAMMTAMRSVEEKADCVVPETEADKEKKSLEGKKEEKERTEVEEGEAESTGNEEAGKEQSFFDSMLSMVGLGGGNETPAKDQAPAAADGQAVVEEPADAAADDAKNASEHEAKAADEVEKTATEGHEPAEAEGHDVPEKPASDHESAEETKVEPTQPSADDDDHAAEEKTKIDQHAEVGMPVGD